VDYSATADGVDLDGLPRGVDLTGVPNLHGASDLGAFERQSYVLVLNGDFDQDINLWTNVATGNYSAAFDATKDHSGASTSGSVDLQYTPSGGGTGIGTNSVDAGDVPVLTQCFGLPNYGTYQLSGYDYRFGSSILMNTVVSLEWNEYDTSFNCSGTPDRQGQLFLPYSNPVAWRAPASPALIASGQVGHAFAHNASVSVTLTFYQPTSATSATATVDGISLVPYNSDEIFANGFEP
jgi:hypothetical protein